MRLIQQLQRLERIHHLIKLQATGTPKEFAEKLNISESTLFEYLQALKKMGGNFSYSRSLQSYYYNEQTHFQLGFSNSDLFQIKGGNTSFHTLRKNRSRLFNYCNALL